MGLYLLGADFDGTFFNTGVDSPNGMNVRVACEEAINDLFKERGREVYNGQLGGLQNREPGELMSHMLTALEIKLVTVQDAAELFVRRKLDYLVPEISRDWPRPYPGVADFFKDLQEGKYPLEVAVVSSGHEKFIRRTFEVNGIDAPENMVTSDDIRWRTQPNRPLYKPNPYQLAVVHRRWMGKEDGFMKSKYTELDHGKDKMAFVGDDFRRDGELAERSLIPFIHMNPDGQDFVPDENRGQVGIKDFNELRGMLDRSAHKMADGKDFSEILVGKPRSEIFPKPLEHEMPYNRMMSAYARR